jgi:hypothetical protein
VSNNESKHIRIEARMYEDVGDIKSSSHEFKAYLDGMTKLELLNFMWLYDQYIVSSTELQVAIMEDENEGVVIPYNLEDYYWKIFLPQFKGEQS